MLGLLFIPLGLLTHVVLGLPQDFNFAALETIEPAPIPSVAIGAVPQIVTYDAASIKAAVTAAPLITATYDDGIAGDKRKRQTGNACVGGTKQPQGAGPVPNPDDPAVFAAYSAFITAANNAVTPGGYVNTFNNSNASANAYGEWNIVQTRQQCYD